jgi:phage terminase large subunit-like protein
MVAKPQIPDGVDPNEWNRWDQKSKEKFLNALALAQKKKLVWFCKNGRTCDGEPHDEYDYFHARADQWPPEGENWLVWLLKGGRGSGKTRSGAEWIRYLTRFMPQVSIIGPTWAHVRDYMVEGPKSGLLKCFENAKIPVLWEPSKRRLTTPCPCKGKPHRTGHIIQVFTGEEPERLRGPEHYAVWLDEPAHMPLIQGVWDNMMLGLRQGKHPRVMCTTTPLPTKWIRDLVADPDTVTATVSTMANAANLSKNFLKQMDKKYKGTRLGRQELEGEILEDIEGALWTRDLINYVATYRTDPEDPDTERPVVTHLDMERVVVAIDPAGTSSKKRDETGIVVVGRLADKYYVLADYSGSYTPNQWAKKAWKAFDEFQADRIVAEKNYGGDMVRSTLTNERENGPVYLVHSRRGKVLRAEPVVSLYEQAVVLHAKQFPELETQMTEWVPDQDDSPDRVDALVHGITSLYTGGGPVAVAVPSGRLGDNSGPGAAQESEADVMQSLGLVTVSSVPASAMAYIFSPDMPDSYGGQKLFGYRPREAEQIPGLSGPLRGEEPIDTVIS